MRQRKSLYMHKADIADQNKVKLCVITVDEKKRLMYQNILSHISVGKAILSFIGIVVFHTYQCLRKLKLPQSMCKRYYGLKMKTKHEEKAYDEQSLEIVTNSSVSLRELLLDDDS